MAHRGRVAQRASRSTPPAAEIWARYGRDIGEIYARYSGYVASLVQHAACSGEDALCRPSLPISPLCLRYTSPKSPLTSRYISPAAGRTPCAGAAVSPLLG